MTSSGQVQHLCYNQFNQVIEAVSCPLEATMRPVSSQSQFMKKLTSDIQLIHPVARLYHVFRIVFYFYTL